MGKLGDVASVEVAHAGYGQAEAIGAARLTAEVREVFPAKDPPHAVARGIVPSELKVIALEIASTTIDVVVWAKEQVGQLRSQGPGPRVDPPFSGVLRTTVQDETITAFFVGNGEPASEERPAVGSPWNLSLRDQDSHSDLQHSRHKDPLIFRTDHVTGHRERRRPSVFREHKVRRTRKDPLEMVRDPKLRQASPNFSRE